MDRSNLGSKLAKHASSAPFCPDLGSREILLFDPALRKNFSRTTCVNFSIILRWTPAHTSKLLEKHDYFIEHLVNYHNIPRIRVKSRPRLETILNMSNVDEKVLKSDGSFRVLGLDLTLIKL